MGCRLALLLRGPGRRWRCLRCGRTEHLWAHYVGAVLGQAAYELAFVKLGPLFILGLAFLAGYSIIFVVAAAIVALLRKAGTSEH